MRLLHLICFGLLAACGGQGSGLSEPTLAADTASKKNVFVLDEALPPAVYTNDAGVQLTIVALKPDGEDQEALIQFKGIRHPLSGKVLLATMNVSRNGDYTWAVQYHGESRKVVRMERSNRGSLKLRTVLVLPRTAVSSHMRYSPELTSELEFQTIVSAHKRHISDGSLAVLAAVPAFDLRAYKSTQKSLIEHTKTKLAKACEGMVMKIDWSTVTSDNSLETYPCGMGIDILVSACTRSVYSTSIVKAKTKRVVCLSGPDSGYSLDKDGTLSIVSSGLSSKADLRKELAALYGFGRVVLKNKKSLVVFQPEEQFSNGVYLGTGTVFHRHRSVRNNLWGVASGRRFKVVDGEWRIYCGQNDYRSFEELPSAEAKKVLAKASFGEQIWKRTPVSLSRDSRGHYYYVDRLQDAYGGKDFRVFRGLRGRLEQTQLIDIINDHAGRIFSTQQGQLRLLLDNDKSVWIAGKKRSQLTHVWQESGSYTEPFGPVAKLIYYELGVYDGEDFGAICY